MITRTYFMHAKILWNDGKGSYSFRSKQVSYRSWLEYPIDIYGQLIDELKKDRKSWVMAR
jgi:hypothetical protein